MSSTLHADLRFLVLDVSSSSSKQLNQPASQSIPPSKLAAIQAQAATSSEKGDTGSHKEGSSGSSPRSEGTSSLFHCILYRDVDLRGCPQTLHYHLKVACQMAGRLLVLQVDTHGELVIGLMVRAHKRHLGSHHQAGILRAELVVEST